jgi:CubicO group peptidase (beta-lactamase class C family)
MSAFSTLDQVLESELERIPSLSVCVRHDGQEVYRRTLGLARHAPRREVLADAAYDLASLTKALAGSVVAAALVERGMIELDAPVSAWLDVDDRVTVAHLLQHASGLPAWAPLYQQVAGAWGTRRARQQVMAAARETRLEADPGARHLYSDLGFIVLLELLERVGGARFDRLFDAFVREPAGIDDLRFGGWPGACATEDCPVRGFVVEGTVHDLNAAALGGLSTHAGLFGTAAAVAGLGERLMDAVAEPGLHPGLPGTALGAFWARRGPGSHVCGWDTRSPGATTTGARFPDDAVGHLGYTGCSLWMSPSRRLVVTVLTNRVHPVDDLTAIRAARPRIHDAVIDALALGS